MPAFLALGLMCAGGAYFAFHPLRPTTSPSPPVLSNASVLRRAPYDPLAIQKQVEFHAGKTRENPRSAMEFAFLAGTYLQRCRETGDIDDALRAEQTARRSLAIRTRHNAGASNLLALSLLTQHRFSEARGLAEKALALDPGDRQAADLRAECLLELGDYEEAGKALRPTGAEDDNATSNSLRARLYAIDGNPTAALTLLGRAQFQVDRNMDMPVANVAWFHMRRGDCLASMGNAREAEQAYREALALFPGDYRTLTALCRLAAGQNHWREAIDWGARAVAIVPMPDALVLLFDAYQASGNAAAARAQVRLLDSIATLSRAHGNLYDRQRALFYADHDLHLKEALTLARAEMKVRHDIYAYDTLAWASFKNGKLKEAKQAIDRALARHTLEAGILYHAGRIACAQGKPTEGRALLEHALAINHGFHPTAPAEARRILAGLPHGTAQR